jgi:DNA-binding winged helix-turn-helix (wHTH) protein/TolB-like protein
VSAPIRFGPFEADVRAGQLRRDGLVVPIQDLPFRLLAALVERPGEIATRAELAERLWSAGTFVDAAAGLNTAVAKLRDALGDQAEQPIYIETIPKRGYRFIGTIESPTAPPVHSVQPFRTARKRRWVWAAAAAVAITAVVATYQLRASRLQTRVAVVLFDNETGRPEISRLSQGLTDAAVFALTANPQLAVIGNAAVLRTPRPFRDIAVVRDALHADFIVIGQVQTMDDRILVRAHLIRAADQTHVWVSQARLSDSEAVLQADVAARIAAAVSSHVAR